MEKNDDKQPADPRAELKAAAVLDEKGRLRGHNVITKDDNLILVSPGVLSLAADTDRGVFVAGLKEGQRLASPADVERVRADRNAKREAAGKPAV